MTAGTEPRVGDRVRVTSNLNQGRYNGRWVTVIAGPTGRSPKFRVQLDEWTRGLEPPDGCLHLYPSELVP